MKLHVGKTVGRIDGCRWGQVYDFTPDDPLKMEVRGRLVVAAGMNSTEDVGQVQMMEKGRELLTRIHHLYYDELERDPVTVITHLLTTISQEYPAVEAAITAYVGNALYMGGTGGVGIRVRVGNKESWVVSPEDARLLVVSGWGVVGEKIMAGTRSFWNHVLTHMPSHYMEQSQGVMEKLGMLEHGSGEAQGEAGVLVEIVELDIKEIAAPSYSQPDTKPVIQPAVEAVSPVQDTPSKEEVFVPRTSRLTGGDFLGKLKERLTPSTPTPVFVQPEDRTFQRKRTMYVGIGMLVLLTVLSVVGRARSREIALKTDETNIRVTALVQKFDEARVLAGLNPASSRTLLEEVQSELTLLESQNVQDKRLAEIKSGLGEVLGAASGVRQFSPSEVVNLSLVREGMTGDTLKLSDGKLWVLDRIGERVVQVDPAKRNGTIILGKEDIPGASILAVYPGKMEIMSSKGVVEWKKGEKAKVVVEKDEDWKDVIDMAMYAGNIYMLDRGANQIWRFAAAEKGFGNGSAWIGKDETVSLGGSTNMAIDGSIWIMGEGGTITKITRGVVDAWSPSEVSDMWGGGAKLFTSEDSEKLYILDASRKRVVVLLKTGAYEKQYTEESLGNATDFAVDEKAGKMYWVSGSQVWEAGL